MKRILLFTPRHLCSYALIALILGAISTPLQANIYQYKDKKGRIVYSDIPIDSDTKVYKKTKIKSEHSAEQRTDIDNAADQSGSNAYQSLKISQPLAGSKMDNRLGSFLVKTELTPSLKKTHKVQLLINGIEQGSNRSNSFKINGAPDGKYRVQVQVVDNNGEALIKSKIHPFEVINSSK